MADLTAKYHLNDIGGRQGWSEHTKLDLACRFIDHLELYVDGERELHRIHMTLTQGTPGEYFEKWLENQADWENNEGLPASRVGPIVDDIVKKLEAAGKTPEDLDEMVHEIYAEMASAVDNTDLEGQVTDLLNNGVSPETILGVIDG